MRRRFAGTVMGTLVITLLVITAPRLTPDSSPAETNGCEERLMGGTSAAFAPGFCVGLPVSSPAADPATVTQANEDACGNRGYVPGFCPGLPGPAFSASGHAPGREGDLICGETGRSSVTPRFCAGLPTIPAAVSGPVRPGIAELEAFTGNRFIAAGTASAFLFLDSALDQQSRTHILASFNEDLVDVQRQFGHTFVRPPAVYVFAGRTSFSRGLVGAFGYPLSVADALSNEHGGVLLPGTDAALVNWESAKGDLSIIRHELVHAAIREIAGLGTIPTWLDEGLATLSKNLDDTPRERRNRYAMRSLIDRGKMSLSLLAFSGPLVQYEYVASAEAADILLEQIGEEGVRRILLATGAGTPFDEAFAAEAKKPVLAFTEQFPSLLRDRLPAPRIVTGDQASNGDVSWNAFGLRPGALATVTIAGGDYHLAYHLTVDGFGAANGTFGSTAPRGLYTLGIDDGVERKSIVLRTMQ